MQFTNLYAFILILVVTQKRSQYIDRDSMCFNFLLQCLIPKNPKFGTFWDKFLKFWRLRKISKHFEKFWHSSKIDESSFKR